MKGLPGSVGRGRETTPHRVHVLFDPGIVDEGKASPDLAHECLSEAAFLDRRKRGRRDVPEVGELRLGRGWCVYTEHARDKRGTDTEECHVHSEACLSARHQGQSFTGPGSVSVDYGIDGFAQSFVARGKVSGGQSAQAAAFLALGRSSKPGANRLVDRLPDRLALERRASLERPIGTCIDVANSGVHVFNVVQV